MTAMRKLTRIAGSLALTLLVAGALSLVRDTEAELYGQPPRDDLIAGRSAPPAE